MKFKFNEDVSRIYDYLLFPRLYFYKYDYEENKNDDLKSVIHEKYLEMAERLNEKLKPYEKEISQYFQKSIYSSYDYPNILTHAFPVEGYTDEHQYLESILDVDDSEFKDKLIKSLVTMEDDEDEKISVDELNSTEYINNLKIDSANKWNLFLMVQNPKKYLKDYIVFLKTVEPLFYNTYNQFKDELIEVGMDISARLSKNTAQSFKKITQNLINYEFSNREVCNLYVSAMFPYSVRLMGDHRIVWGLKSEFSFKKVSEINENQLSQRVKIFKALGDKTRYEVLKMISNGHSSIKNIAEKLDVSSATISYHVNEFLTTGIISINRDKDKKAGYRIDYHKLNEVISGLKEDLNFE
ncbi:MAG: ArsR/SmtB family transcription factor [Candidatus Izemoplasmatales bacterium]